MILNISVKSEQLNVEDLRALLQAVRDCEMANFPDKEIHVYIEVPQLNMAETVEILTSIKPPYKHGPTIFRLQEE
ncbi:hypothetical protein ES703_55645 [subsurface metagenome]